MNSPGDDNRLQELFSEMRERELRSAPSFESVLREGRPVWRRLSLMPSGLKLALAALIALVVLSPLFLFRQSAGGGGLNSVDVSALEIVRWDSPTEFLMESDNQLLTEIPSFGDDLGDWMQSAGGGVVQ